MREYRRWDIHHTLKGYSVHRLLVLRASPTRRVTGVAGRKVAARPLPSCTVSLRDESGAADGDENERRDDSRADGRKRAGRFGSREWYRPRVRQFSDAAYPRRRAVEFGSGVRA